MKGDLIQVTLDEQDEPVLAFSHSAEAKTLDQKILGALIRKMARQGAQLHLVAHYNDADEKPHWDYHIRPHRDEFDQRPTT